MRVLIFDPLQAQREKTDLESRLKAMERSVNELVQERNRVELLVCFYFLSLVFPLGVSLAMCLCVCEYSLHSVWWFLSPSACCVSVHTLHSLQ